MTLTSSLLFNVIVTKLTEILIEGGGIIGSCSAYFLTRHPSFDPARHKITLIEATEIAGGASGKAGGLLGLWAYPSCIVPLSYKLHAELAKEHDGVERWGYREVNCGQISARGRQVPDKDAKEKDIGRSVSLGKRTTDAIAQLRKAGVPQDLDWFVPGSIKEYESMSGPGETAQVHPYYFTTSIAKFAEEKGTKIILGSVTDIGRSASGVNSVTYTEKESGQVHAIPATDVIVTAGPWTKNLLPTAPITPTRAHSTVIRPTRPLSAYTLFTAIQLPANFYPSKKSSPEVVMPEIYGRPDNTVYCCGEGDHIEPLPKTTADVKMDPHRCQAIFDQVGSISDELRDGEVKAQQACYLPNGGPLVGHTGVKGLYLAAGHTCWGINNSTGTGKVISEFIFDGKAISARVGSLDPRNYL